MCLVYVQMGPYDAHCTTSTQFYSLVNIQHTYYATLYLCHDFEAHLRLFFRERLLSKEINIISN